MILHHLEILRFRHGRLVAFQPSVAPVIPVLKLRIVDAEVHTLLGTCIRQLLDDIALKGGGIHDVVIGVLCIEQTEPVMVFGCDHDVLHARRLGQRDPRFGIKLDRVELLGQFPVSLSRNCRAGH